MAKTELKKRAYPFTLKRFNFLDACLPAGKVVFRF
jgi:hypothetical protein